MKFCRYLAITLAILAFNYACHAQSGKITAGAGKAINATSIQFQGASVSFEEAGKRRELKVDTLQAVTLKENVETEEQPIEVTLVDGSRVVGTDFSVNEKNATVQTLAGRPLSLELKNVQKVRLQKLNAEQAAAWEVISESVANSDLLVAIQRGGALTKIEGLVLGIQNSAIRFDFSGQEINVPFSKASGVRFFTSRKAEDANRVNAVVEDIHGNRWQTEKLTSQGSMANISLVCGADVELILSDITKVDFSFGSAQFLADIETLSVKAQPIFNFKNSPSFTGVLGIRNIDGSTISNSTPGPSLEFVGDGEAVYRIPEGFSRLVGNVRLNPVGDYFTPCKVRIELENKVLWEEQLSAPRMPVSFEVPIVADQRLRLIVSSGDSLPTGNTVFWHAPRLLR